MCTLTYIPLKKDNFIITSNRDESVKRDKALLPELYEFSQNNHLLYPKDPAGGGTWIAVSLNAGITSIMNGAFGQYRLKKNYKISRGKVVLERYHYKTINEFLKGFDFNGIAPFTMILTENKIAGPIYEVKWNEVKLYIKKYSKNKAMIFNSPNLFQVEKQKLIKKTFKKWLVNNAEPDQNKVIDFHIEKDSDYQCGIMINYKKTVKTVSTTSILVNSKSIIMIYLDHITKQKITKKLKKI